MTTKIHFLVNFSSYSRQYDYIHNHKTLHFLEWYSNTSTISMIGKKKCSHRCSFFSWYDNTRFYLLIIASSLSTFQGIHSLCGENRRFRFGKSLQFLLDIFEKALEHLERFLFFWVSIFVISRFKKRLEPVWLAQCVGKVTNAATSWKEELE